MKHHVLATGILHSLIALSAGAAFAGSQIGGGIHYLATVGDIKDSPQIDDSNFNFVASYKWTGAGLIAFEGDVEFVPDYLGSNEMLYQPQAYALIGGLIYGGAGIGIGYLDGEWFDNPFYALRAGVDLPVGNLHVDVNANYRFLSSKALQSLNETDLDSVTFGAIVRFGL
jgi:hypothetical protein